MSRAGSSATGWKRQWRWLSWVLVALVVAASLLVGVLDNNAPRSNAERASALSSTIRCPKCTGQSVAESDVAVARVIRAEIKRQVDAGATDDQIRQSLVDGYGEGILLTPSGDGLVGLVWVIPVVAAALATLALGLAFARWRRMLDGESDDGDQELTEADIALVESMRSAGRLDEPVSNG